MQKTPATTDKPVMERGCRLLVWLIVFWICVAILLLGIAWGLALVLRLRLATVDPVDKPRTFFRFHL